MRQRTLTRRTGWAGTALAVALVGVVQVGVAEPRLTQADQVAFLETAEVIASRRAGSGVTEPWRLTLSDGTVEHDALFQSVEVRRSSQRLGRGRREVDFADLYKFNIAAYKLAELLELDHMMPVTVERTWRGKTGSLTWWVDDVLMDEKARRERGIQPPDHEQLWEQRYRMYVFGALVHDTDRNLGNSLYDDDWRLWMIDFARAFRIWPELSNTAGGWSAATAPSSERFRA